MAAFYESDLNYRERLDWALLQNGPIALFHEPHVLAAAVEWLKQHGYVIAEANCGSCDSEIAILNTIRQAFGFPEVPTPNLDSFNDDCWHGNIDVPEDGGYALVLL